MKKIKSFDRIGWIGLGAVGCPLCEDLVTAGYIVKVFDQDKRREKPLNDLGLLSAADPVDLIRRSEIVMVAVSGDSDPEELFTGNAGLLHAGVSGKTIIHIGCVSLPVSKKLELLCKEQGIGYLEATLTGFPSTTNPADLIIMAGGDQQYFDQSKPVLESLGGLTIYTGSVGSGQAAAAIIADLFKLYA